MNPKWCEDNVCCNGHHYINNKEGYCKRLHDPRCCPYYNPKMTFFEAWEKAQNLDIIEYIQIRLYTRMSLGANLI